MAQRLVGPKRRETARKSAAGTMAEPLDQDDDTASDATLVE